MDFVVVVILSSQLGNASHRFRTQSYPLNLSLSIIVDVCEKSPAESGECGAYCNARITAITIRRF